MNKMYKNGGNKTQRLYRCGSNYALPKLIEDNGHEHLWRRKKPDSSELTRYDSSSGIRSRIDRVCTDIKIASNTKINQIMVSSTDHYNAISLDRLPSKTKIGKEKWHFNNSLLHQPHLQRICFFLLKTKKPPILQQVTGGNTQVLVLNKMLWHYPKIPRLKKRL